MAALTAAQLAAVKAIKFRVADTKAQTAKKEKLIANAVVTLAS